MNYREGKMNQAAWIKAAQGVVMFLAALGIEVTDADATTIVAGAFGVLSVLSAIKAWMSKEKKPTPEQLATVAHLDQMIKRDAATEMAEKAREQAYLARVDK